MPWQVWQVGNAAAKYPMSQQVWQVMPWKNNQCCGK